MSYHEIIVNRITALCRERGFSINQLAMMSNIGQSTLDNIIHGNSKNPTIQTLHKIALAFHMTVAEFLDYPELNHYSFDEAFPDEQENGDLYTEGVSSVVAHYAAAKHIAVSFTSGRHRS